MLIFWYVEVDLTTLRIIELTKVGAMFVRKTGLIRTCRVAGLAHVGSSNSACMHEVFATIVKRTSNSKRTFYLEQ